MFDESVGGGIADETDDVPGSETTPDSPVLIGSDQIKLIEKLGEGTHGLVYKAHVTLNGKRVSH